MGDDHTSAAREAMEREKARLLEQLAEIDRDMAAIDRLASKYGLIISKSERASAAIEVATIADLAQLYLTRSDSPFAKHLYTTKKNYETLTERIATDFGTENIKSLQAADFRRFYDRWAAGGTVAIAKSLTTMLRMLLGFGTDILKDKGCEHAAFVLHREKFDRYSPKEKKIKIVTSREDALKIIARAHETGNPGVAMAQAIHFDCMQLKQKDVLGEWIPQNEPGESEIIDAGQKWMRGIRWNQLNSDLILRHKALEFHFGEGSLTKTELVRPTCKRTDHGPIVLNHSTGLPYKVATYRWLLKGIAEVTGVWKPPQSESAEGLEPGDSPN